MKLFKIYTAYVKMEYLKKKHVRLQWYPNQLYGFPLNIMYTLDNWETPSTDADKHAFGNSQDFKNRYVYANLNLQSSKIVVNIYH